MNATGQGGRGPLETVKLIAEVLAIVGAGGWALTEYGLKAHEDRLEGMTLRRLTLGIQAQTTKAADQNWMLGQLKLRNDSKRIVRPFMISWWYVYLEGDGGADEVVAPVKNHTIEYNIAPGEESFDYQHFVVPAGLGSVILHAHVMLRGDEDALDCHVTSPLPDGGVGAMEDQPEVCTVRTGTTACADVGCPSQQQEVLVQFTKGDGK